jgi:hypothetical protein
MHKCLFIQMYKIQNNMEMKVFHVADESVFYSKGHNKVTTFLSERWVTTEGEGKHTCGDLVRVKYAETDAEWNSCCFHAGST